MLPLGPLVTARAEAENAALAVGLVPQQALGPQPAAPSKPEPRPSDASGPSSSRTSRWAALLARIYETFPLVCPSCGSSLTFIAFLTDPQPIGQMLAHIGEPPSPPLLHLPRGPPQTEFDLDGPQAEEMDPATVQDHFDQSSVFDPADPEPAPEFDDLD